MAFTELIYVSTMMGEAEHALKAILESSVRHNQLHGITGMLLYCRGRFLQVLEGSEAEVMKTYARICDDPRHQHVTTLATTKVQRRHFGSWSMGFKHVSASEIAQFPQLAQIFDLQIPLNAVNAKPGLALEMLSLFGTGLVWRAAAA